MGLACRTPGAADPDELWAALTADRELLDLLPPDGTDPAVVPTLGWLADHDAFDADFFGIGPREAETTDPQHRVLLECAWAALEDAGRVPSRFPGTVGVYVGSGESDHLVRLLARPDLVRSLGPMRLRLSNLKDYLAPRLAHRLGLTGPAITVQTACSTSLVAVHLARRALLAGECDLAIAGGVSITTLERTGYRYEEGGIFARDGHCRSFAPDATGTVPGNGVGLVVLRRLADAVRDGDPVRAVLRGSAVNNDGPVRAGFTAPGVDGQARVISRALADAGLRQDEVDVVEAHGTGTVLGDAIERAALDQVFGRRDRPLWIGSVKSNVGHLDTSAGVIGLVKTVLAVEHARLPASLHVADPGAGAVRVNVVTRPWPGDDDRPRRAGVSSFGMGGTNAHVIVEQAPPRDASDGPRRPELVVVSAADARGREEAVDRLRRWAARHPDGSVADVAATLGRGREHLPFRASLTCRDVGALARTAPEHWTRGGPARRPVVFAFPGQGTWVPGLGAGLYAEEPVFRDAVDEAAELLAGPRDLRQVMFGPDDGPPGGHLQPALFVLEYALARLWQSFGVEPVAMIGHSLGEYTAATLSGVLTLDDALALVAERGRLMERLPPGAMLAVALSEEELAERLPGRLLDALDLAAVNGPAQCALAGPPDAVAELARFAVDARVPHRRLATAHAFHSRMCVPVAAEFAEFAARRPYAEPGLPYVSTVSGDWVTSVDGDHWATQLRGTVRFSAGVRTVLAHHPDAVFLEVGPGSTLSGMVRQHQPGAGRRASLPRPVAPASERPSLLTAAGALWCDGVALRWETLAPGGRIIPLPTYPFHRRTFPVPGTAPAPAPPRQDAPPAATPATALDGLEPLVGLFWEELLGTGDLTPGSDFIALGGDSLVAARLVARIADVLGVELPVRTVFDHPLLGAQARALEDAAHRQLGEERAAELLAEAGALTHEGTRRQE
ncbi:hypothetical protein BLA60_04760 [Actinophytocola xinjiangensis]|uniref:Acyl transferase domain-containing protein n=1 Tax=Actinophytocola xinjiangensis TaxID=485602 RepID=A0A7Z1B1D6_9PSEU|nr:hypothetical protein BLA60_04760 [Actinophytocola xinjiangensis]